MKLGKVLICSALLSSVHAFAPNAKKVSLSRDVHELNVATTNRRMERSLPRVTEDSNQNALAEFSEGYQQFSREHYLPTAFLQAGILASGADIATQTMEAASIDFGHVAAMATVASTMSGLMNAIWLKQLEQAFPGTETKEVACKTLIHAVIIASIINSAYLAFVPFLGNVVFNGDVSVISNFNAETIFGSWTIDEFITLTKLEVAMFIPYNTLAFKFVPESVRPLTHASISATFNVAVSAVTLGYFDKWCQTAMDLVS